MVGLLHGLPSSRSRLRRPSLTITRVYEDSRVRILDVQIEPRGSTLLHRHDTPYVWVDDTDRCQLSRAGIRPRQSGITSVIVECCSRKLVPAMSAPKFCQASTCTATNLDRNGWARTCKFCLRQIKPVSVCCGSSRTQR